MKEEEIERLEWEQGCRDNRRKEQEEKKDYAYLDDGSIEKCDVCGSPINSHDHCPLCDY